MVAIKKTIDQVLKRPMDRRDFLAQSGALLLAVVGVSAVLKSLNIGDVAQGGGVGSPQGTAYGASAYGGKRTV